MPMLRFMKLSKQLEDEKSLKEQFEFIRRNSLLTGKVNTLANQILLPQAPNRSLRDDRPVNLVSAFEEPVKSNGWLCGKIY